MDKKLRTKKFFWALDLKFNEFKNSLFYFEVLIQRTKLLYVEISSHVSEQLFLEVAEGPLINQTF